MKIIYIHQYFKTYTEGGSSRSYYLAKALVDSGLQVEMITSHNQKQYVCKTVSGIRVHYLPVYYDNKLGFAGRTYAFLRFAWQAYRLARKIGDADLCYATSTPLTVGITALLLKWRKNIPFYFEVRDLWPLAPIQMGTIRNRWLQKTLFALERKIYGEADTIVALSPGIAEYIENQRLGKEIHVLPNISDCVFFQNEAKNPLLAEKYGVSGKFTVTYFGAVGKANHVQSLLEIARQAQADELSQLTFLVVGQGNEWTGVQQLARQYGLKNLRLIPHLDKYQLREVLNVTDAVYVSFARKKVLETSSPNKFFDALAAGKLCITNTGGWIAELVETENCGFYADPEQPGEFLRRLAPYLSNPAALAQARQNARKLAETRFSRVWLTGTFARLLQGKTVAPTACEAASVEI